MYFIQLIGKNWKIGLDEAHNFISNAVINQTYLQYKRSEKIEKIDIMTREIFQILFSADQNRVRSLSSSRPLHELLQ